MKKSLHQKFVDALRVTDEKMQGAKDSDIEPDEEDIMQKLEKRYEELFGPLNDDD